MIEFNQNDGGRSTSGYIGRGAVGDCFCRAVAIAAEIPYKEAYTLINELAKEEKPKNGKKRSSARNGVHMVTAQKVMERLGWKWVATSSIGQRDKVHVSKDELPSGRIILRLSRHFAAVIDGVLNDQYDSSRYGNRCVYGYWHK